MCSHLEAIDKQVQYAALQVLADDYANTGKFTIPEVIEKVRSYQEQTQQQWEAAYKSADPKALTQILIARAKLKAQGQEKFLVA